MTARSAWGPRLAGATAAAAALGASELLAGVIASVPSLIVAVGDLIIDVVPAPVEDAAIALFGVADKVVLVAGILLVGLLAGAALGRLGAARLWPAAFGLAGFGLLGLLAAARQPGVAAGWALASAAASTAVGVWALASLLRRVPEPEPGDWRSSRRAFLRSVGVTAAAGVLAGVGGRTLAGRPAEAEAGREAVTLPHPEDGQGPAPAAASLAVPGLSPLVTPNERFYRIDTALVVPRLGTGGWRLSVGGLVDRPFELGYEELLSMPMVERYVTLSCVSNEVGGGLVGNALWLGVPLVELLDRAGVRPEAGQVVGRASDGFTVGFPTAAAYDGRDALVAVGMNGEPLPYEHGFPARLVVAGLYGYVSATKWLTEIELATWEGFDAYWVPRGWAKEGPVKTQSRIDVPRSGARLPAGPVAVAGVAWAPNRGIERVEVQVDEGPWREARLAEILDDDAWRQWVYQWDARPGSHVLRVRATDGTGAVQTAERSRPRPDGASGHHEIGLAILEG